MFTRTFWEPPLILPYTANGLSTFYLLPTSLQWSSELGKNYTYMCAVLHVPQLCCHGHKICPPQVYHPPCSPSYPVHMYNKQFKNVFGTVKTHLMVSVCEVSTSFLVCIWLRIYPLSQCKYTVKKTLLCQPYYGYLSFMHPSS